MDDVRPTLLALLLASAACGVPEDEHLAALAMARDSTRAATLAEVGRTLATTARSIEEEADDANSILRPWPLMTPGEEQALRTYLNASHIATARALGVRVDSEEMLDSLVAEGRLVELEDSTEYWVVREGTSPAPVVPHVRVLLETLGERFHARLAEAELPPYRFEITSGLRTASRQARLRRSNPNAASGVSSHEFGTTLDLSYSAFSPPLRRPETPLADVPTELRPHMERYTDLAFESVSGRKSRELGQIFSRVLIEAQAEGIAIVIYERQQTVYHLTVARALAEE